MPQIISNHKANSLRHWSPGL